MEFGVLGPVLVRRDGRDEQLRGPKQRSLLAMLLLLLRANEGVARDRKPKRNYRTYGSSPFLKSFQCDLLLRCCRSPRCSISL